jgi:hypothetical protein
MVIEKKVNAPICLDLHKDRHLLVTKIHVLQISNGSKVLLNQFGMNVLRDYYRDNSTLQNPILDPCQLFTVESIHLDPLDADQLANPIVRNDGKLQYGYAVISANPFGQNFELTINLACIDPAAVHNVEQHYYVIGTRNTLVGHYAYVGRECCAPYCRHLQLATRFATFKDAVEFLRKNSKDPVQLSPSKSSNVEAGGSPRLGRNGLAYYHFGDSIEEGTFEILEVHTSLDLIKCFNESDFVEDKHRFQQMLK